MTALEQISKNMKKLKIPFSKAKRIFRGFKGAGKLRRDYKDGIPPAQSTTRLNESSPPPASPPPASPPPSPERGGKQTVLSLQNDMSDWNAGKDGQVKASSKEITVSFPRGVWASRGGCNMKFKPTGYRSAESLEVTYDLYVPPDFEFVKGGKMGIGMNIGRGTGGHNWSNDGSFRAMWRRGGQLVGYLYLPQTIGKYEPENEKCPMLRAQPAEFIEAIGGKAPSAGLDVFRFTKRKLWLKKGQWNAIRLRAVMNDVGKQNGRLEMELNGEKAETDIVWRGKASEQFDQLQLACWFGGGDKSWAPVKNETIKIRDVCVAFE